jgi:protease-4
MSLEVDLLVDRRRLKRRLFYWRGATILAVLACLLVGIGRGGGAVVSQAHIARLTVTGIISEDRKLTAEVTRLADDDSVKALLVEIDSPGGAVSGGEALHDAISHVAAKKPVVSVMGGTAASAGYMIAVPAARIFARNATLTGSIGVILETGEASGLLAHLGITADAITSGPLKDQPSFVKPMTSEGRAVLHALVMDLFDQFVAMVASGRHMTEEQVRALADGRAYTGRQAIGLGLVDEIGGEADARRWLQAERGVATSLPVQDVTTKTWIERNFANALGGISNGLLKSVLFQGVRLDGAWAVWQPSAIGD